MSKYKTKKYIEGRDYQPYLTTTLPGSDRDSNMEDCDASPWFKKYMPAQISPKNNSIDTVIILI